MDENKVTLHELKQRLIDKMATLEPGSDYSDCEDLLNRINKDILNDTAEAHKYEIEMRKLALETEKVEKAEREHREDLQFKKDELKHKIDVEDNHYDIECRKMDLEEQQHDFERRKFRADDDFRQNELAYKRSELEVRRKEAKWNFWGNLFKTAVGFLFVAATVIVEKDGIIQHTFAYKALEKRIDR